MDQLSTVPLVVERIGEVIRERPQQWIGPDCPNGGGRGSGHHLVGVPGHRRLLRITYRDLATVFVGCNPMLGALSRAVQVGPVRRRRSKTCGRRVGMCSEH